MSGAKSFLFHTWSHTLDPSHSSVPLGVHDLMLCVCRWGVGGGG
uniref:Uncharacterized protein n=1 Tax=Anguilla anguilla TaxID=7936 RepID=A0A0E9S5B0_ANGAN